MSRENLESLLDSMLEESATKMEAEEARAREVVLRAEREQQASVLRERAEDPAVATFHEIVTLAGLPDEQLRKVLAKAPPDDLLIILATAADSLQRRILTNLTAESVAWLRQNLVHIETVSNAEREAAERKVLKAANALLAGGEIGLPESEPVGSETAPDRSENDLRDLLTDLVRIAREAGPAALSEVLGAGGEPLLEEGLALVIEGTRGEALRTVLATRRAELAADYARRLAWMEDAVLSIAEGEPAESFRARLFRA